MDEIQDIKRRAGLNEVNSKWNQANLTGLAHTYGENFFIQISRNPPFNNGQQAINMTRQEFEFVMKQMLEYVNATISRYTFNG